MFGRIRTWVRRHATLVDALGVAPFLVLYSIGIPDYIGTGHPSGVPAPAHIALTLALLLPLIWRRRFPLGVFATLAAAAAVQSVAGFNLFWADFAVVVGLYTVVVHCRLVWALASLAAVELDLALMLVFHPEADWGDWDVVAWYSVLVMLCWVTGLYTKVRRDYLLGLEERARWLERERDARAQAAIAEERARIAREMHDVVAHNLSVMVVQADGATYAIDSDPDQAKGALETVAATGRSALAEMRGILGVLRDGGHEDRYAPRPGMEQLEELLARVRRAGTPVESRVAGAARQLPAGVELAAYRVVQEALTNTLKHAGPGLIRARVDMYYGDEILEIRVSDDGRGAAAPQEADPGTGQGLIGMRERVAAYGGTVQAGPCSDGGYEVVASLPLHPVAA